MKFFVLEADAFSTEYRKAFQMEKLRNDVEREGFRKEVFTVQGAVLDALKQKWKENEDFEVGWDFDYCYHTCGGIYSDRIFCSDYPSTIRDALESVDPQGRWTYHTGCAIIINPDGKTLGEMTEERGEFFVRGGICYINGKSMKREWRIRLGCQD